VATFGTDDLVVVDGAPCPAADADLLDDLLLFSAGGLVVPPAVVGFGVPADALGPVFMALSSARVTRPASAVWIGPGFGVPVGFDVPRAWVVFVVPALRLVCPVARLVVPGGVGGRMPPSPKAPPDSRIRMRPFGSLKVVGLLSA
jgi:hypothetical protein